MTAGDFARPDLKMTRIASHESHHEPAVYRSLGLNALLASLTGDRKYYILDLGPALGVNVDFWSRLNCRLHIEDFYNNYVRRKASGTEESSEAIFADLLPYGEETRFDVILAWDLFNYLDLEELGALVQRLAGWCHPGTLLFALLSYQPTIPAQPTLFKIVDSERMMYQTATSDTRPCPRYQPRDIAKLMARFNVSSSFLMRHGVQEYMFSFNESTPHG